MKQERESMQRKIRLIKLLKSAIRQSEILNDQIDSMHAMLVNARSNKKAA